jgi:hypothetical protein
MILFGKNLMMKLNGIAKPIPKLSGFYHIQVSGIYIIVQASGELPFNKG